VEIRRSARARFRFDRAAAATFHRWWRRRSSPPASPGRHTNIWLFLLLVLAIGRLWVTPLASPFWVDEMGTAFVVQHGASDPTLRVAPQVPESLYYLLPAIAQRVFGFSEIAYRVPSLIALGIGLLLIARIASRLIHSEAGWFAAFACLFLRDFNFEAADARPYALATCVTAAALYFLIRWLDRARWPDALAFAAAAALVWRVHLVLWPIYVLFAIYAVSRLLRRDTPVRWPQALLVFGAVGLALLPVLAEAWAINLGAGSHVVVDQPGSADLTRSLKLDLIVPCCAAAALLARWFGWPRAKRIASADAWTLVLGWWLIHPLCLYAFSKVTGNSVFVPRYLYVAMPGAALLATMAVGAFVPASQWKRLTVLAGLLLLVFMGRWNHAELNHSGSDWRTAAHELQRAAGRQTALVICPSPFVEAQEPVWRPDYPIQSFLYSQLLVYPPPGKLYPFPYRPSPAAAQFAATLSNGELSATGRFFLYGGDKNVEYWRTWFSARPELAGWQISRIGLYGDVELDEFARSR
jgi:4-amino-4-deoxy-L-arabinose transferase-like glycosyltransferase